MNLFAFRWRRSSAECATKADLTNAVHLILMKESEAVAAINRIGDQLEKVATEITKEIANLKSSDPDLTPQGDAAIERLQRLADAVDAIVPDDVAAGDPAPVITPIA